MNWEDGQIKAVTIAATAGTANADKSPGAYKKWKIIAGAITLVNDATVANRNLILATYNETPTLDGQIYFTMPNLAASATGYYYIKRSATCDTGSTNGGTAYIVIPDGLIINKTGFLRISVGTGKAGDSFSGVLTVIELPA